MMTTTKIGKQAIVIGGSLIGLSAARVLADHFEQVMVIERDTPPQTPDPRKGAPQSQHVHALLKSGELAFEKLFPGSIDEIVAGGGKQIDFSEDVRWFHAGAWKMRYKSGFHIMIQTRPLIEHVIRQRVQASGNVTFFYGYEVETLSTTEDKRTVTGVTLQKMDNRSEKLHLDATLVIDASGRGSKTPQWLEQLGYSAPQETTLKIDLSYSSRVYEAPENATPDWKLLVVNPYTPDSVRAGYIFPVENNRWLVTFAGYSGDETPHDNESFMEYAQGLAQPDIYEAMKGLKPITDVKVFKVPKTVRRHYEKLARIPAGLLVMGDAFCAFDPVFGQGMSAGAKEAVALQELLARESAASIATLPQRFHKRAAQIVEPAWLLASSEDFRYPGTVGEKPFFIPILHWYSNHIFTLSTTDVEIYTAFREVMHLLQGAPLLFKPTIVWKVLKHALSSKRQPAPNKRASQAIPAVG